MIFLLRMTVPLILTPVKMMKMLTCQVTFVERKASVDYNYYLGRANNYLPGTLFVSKRQEFTPRVVRSRMCPRTNFRVYVRFISKAHTLYYMVWVNSLYVVTPPLVSPQNAVWETSAEISYWWPDLGGASDWLRQISHAARPIRSTIRIVKLLLASYLLRVLWKKCLCSCSLCFFTAAHFHIGSR